jgi:hypothetical protein
LLVTCSDCGSRVSSLADECNNCGFPIKKYKKELVQKEEESIQTEVLFREKEEIQNRKREEIQNDFKELERKYEDEKYEFKKRLAEFDLKSTAYIIARNEFQKIISKISCKKTKIVLSIDSSYSNYNYLLKDKKTNGERFYTIEDEGIKNKISEVDEKFEDEFNQLRLKIVRSKVGTLEHKLAVTEHDSLILKKYKILKEVIGDTEYRIREIEVKERGISKSDKEKIKGIRINSLNNWGCFTEIIIWIVIINIYSINESMGHIISYYLFIRLLLFIWIKFKYL